MPRDQGKAASGGMTRKPKITSGPTVITPREMVTPMMRYNKRSQASTFRPKVTAMSRS